MGHWTPTGIGPTDYDDDDDDYISVTLSVCPSVRLSVCMPAVDVCLSVLITADCID